MASVNRNEPKRAKSSESTYSMMEFTREFPDDKACLDWLWRTRFAADGSHTHCPKCDREVTDPLVCGDCAAVICRACGTPLEKVDELGIG